jgi:hypothetical protein
MADLTELMQRVQDYLQEIDESGRLKATRVLRSLNDGYVDFVEQTRCMSRTLLLDSVIGQASYTLPSDVVRIVRVTFAGAELSPTTLEMLNSELYGWQEQANGTPTAWYRDGATSIAFYPTPSTAVADTISIFAEIVPSAEEDGVALFDLASMDASPALPYPYQKAPALYAIYDLAAHIFTGDPEQSASGKMALAEYQQMVKGFQGSMVVEGAYR